MEVAATAARAGMAGMPVGVVADGERHRFENGESLAQAFDGISAQAGRTFLNGLTTTVSYTPAAM